jgi:hypothetical protein
MYEYFKLNDRFYPAPDCILISVCVERQLPTNQATESILSSKPSKKAFSLLGQFPSHRLGKRWDVSVNNQVLLVVVFFLAQILSLLVKFG